MERMERRLLEASMEGNVSFLHGLLQEDPLILDRVMLNETPLHVASMLGHLDFVKEILSRKPELAAELDSQRSSSLHLASAKGHVEIVKALVLVNPDMCLARDRDGRNPLHLAAMKGRVEVLIELVAARLHAARATVFRGETILHMCVRHHQFEALKFLVETMGDHEFVNSKDEDGNTVLHLAVADKQIETIKFLLLNSTIEVNTPNVDGDTAMDILAQSQRDRKDKEIEESLTRAGAFEPRRKSPIAQVHTDQTLTAMGSTIQHPEKHKRKNDTPKQHNWLQKKRNTLMVVASLIATMAFQAAVNPPCGVWQEELTVDSNGNPVPNPHRAGSSVMADNHPVAYKNFLVANTTGFITSLSIILLLISGLPFRRRLFMWGLMVGMWFAITAMSITFIISIAVLTPDHGVKILDSVSGVIVIVWILLMALLLIAHTIRLVVRSIRKVMRKLLQRRRRGVLQVQRP